MEFPSFSRLGAGCWICSSARRSSGRGCSSPARSRLQAGGQSCLPKTHAALPCLEPAGKWRGTNCSGFGSGSAGGGRGGPWSPERSPCAFTWLCCDPAVPGAARRLASRAQLPRSVGASLGAPWGVPSWGLGLMCPGPQHSLWQRRADLKPPQPWGQSWPLGTTACSLWQVPPRPLRFCPWTPVAALSVEDTCVLMHVFFLSLSLWLFILCPGGTGAWLHARGTHVPCGGEQCPHGKAVRGGGAGQGAPSLLSKFTLLLTSIADLPLAATIFSSVRCREHHVPGQCHVEGNCEPISSGGFVFMD